MATIEERIRLNEEKLKQLKAKKQQIEARKRTAESKARRSADTRKKILIGGAVLAVIAKGGDSGASWEAALRKLLDAGLTRPDDRALFDLGEKNDG